MLVSPQISEDLIYDITVWNFLLDIRFYFFIKDLESSGLGDRYVYSMPTSFAVALYLASKFQSSSNERNVYFLYDLKLYEYRFAIRVCQGFIIERTSKFYLSTYICGRPKHLYASVYAQCGRISETNSMFTCYTVNLMMSRCGSRVPQRVWMKAFSGLM